MGFPFLFKALGVHKVFKDNEKRKRMVGGTDDIVRTYVQMAAERGLSFQAPNYGMEPYPISAGDEKPPIPRWFSISNLLEAPAGNIRLFQRCEIDFSDWEKIAREAWDSQGYASLSTVASSLRMRPVLLVYYNHNSYPLPTAAGAHITYKVNLLENYEKAGSASKSFDGLPVADAFSLMLDVAQGRYDIREPAGSRLANWVVVR